MEKYIGILGYADQYYSAPYLYSPFSNGELNLMDKNT